MSLKSVLAYLKQPTTITGTAALVGVGATAVTHLFLKDMPMAAVIGAAVFGVISVAMPDNSAEARSAEKMVRDAVASAIQNKLMAQLPLLVGDAVDVIRNLVPSTVATATAAVSVTGAGATVAAAADALALGVADAASPAPIALTPAAASFVTGAGGSGPAPLSSGVVA